MALHVSLTLTDTFLVCIVINNSVSGASVPVPTRKRQAARARYPWSKWDTSLPSTGDELW